MRTKHVRAGWGAVGTAAMVVAGGGMGATHLAAQEKPVEFGVDGGIVHARLDDFETPGGAISGSKSTGFVFPAAGLRLGFWLGERAALDVAGSVAIQRFESGDSQQAITGTGISLLPGLVWHFADAGRHNQPYVRAEAGLRFSDSSNVDATTQFQAGAAAGVKVPIARTAFLRFEAGYRRMFDTDRLRGMHEFRLGTGLVAVIN